MNKMLDATEVKKFRQMIDRSTQVVLTGHVRPDGDSVGSTLGLAWLLRSMGKSAVVVMPDAPPRSVSFLPGFKDIAIYTKHEEYCRRVVAEADLIICCDFNKPSRQDNMASLIQDATCCKILIDHHLDPDDFADLVISYPDMSSTCELMFRVIAAAGLYDRMSLDAATCLLTGIITDTRNLSVNCKNPDLYKIVQLLLEKGCDKIMIVREALSLRSYSSLRLEAYAIANKLEVFPKSRLAVITIDKDELKQFKYERGDTEGIVNRPLEIRGMVASFFLREDSDCIKVSARSLYDFPVSIICEELYGGGGHRMAAGAEFHGSLEECRELLVNSISKYSEYLPQGLEKIEI